MVNQIHLVSAEHWTHPFIDCLVAPNCESLLSLEVRIPALLIQFILWDGSVSGQVLLGMPHYLSGVHVLCGNMFSFSGKL
ncbi:hypothetical protein CDAR_458281, partial [Caerostris darwini]